LLTVLRLIIAVPAMMAVFVPLVLTLLLVLGSISVHVGMDQDAGQSLELPTHAAVFAVGAFISIVAGAALVPTRMARLAVGVLSVNLVLPLVALTLQQVLTTGEAGYGGSEVGEIVGAGAGAWLAYRSWGRRRQRRAAPALSNRAELVILAACALLLLLPLRSITVPSWRVRFVDRAEQPLASLAIKQSWADFSVEGQVVGHEEVAATDAQGFVAFPERVLWAPVALRLWGPVRNLLTAFIHASSGRYASLTPLCPLRAVDPERTYYLGQSLAEQVHLAEAEGSIVSDNADCQRLIEQARRARMAR
jgi:hypothetical protein